MKLKSIVMFASILCLLSIVSCSTIPKRYTNLEIIERSERSEEDVDDTIVTKKVGWLVSDETDEGFYLETVYYEYVYSRVSDEEMNRARDKFKEIAFEESVKRNYRIESIKNGDMNTFYHINGIDGYALIHIDGPIYKK